jgi:hypothetical protein
MGRQEEHAPRQAAQLSRPPYVEAFECFTLNKKDNIEAFVAFGMFIASEYEYASNQEHWPEEQKVREYYARLLHNSEVSKTENAAKQIVDEHREKIVSDHQRKFLDSMYSQAFSAAVESLKNKGLNKVTAYFRGVSEAVIGAAVWTCFLIAVTVIANRAGIDLLEVYSKAVGTHHETTMQAQHPRAANAR